MVKRIFRPNAELRKIPFAERVNARVPMERDLWRRLADEARARDTSAAEIMRVLAARWIDLLDAANPRHS